MYVLGGAVSDGENTFTAGKTGCYVGQELSVQDMDLQALSSFALDCVLGCGESIFCSADEVQAVLDGRNVPADVIQPENPETPDTTDTPDVSSKPDKPNTPDTPVSYTHLDVYKRQAEERSASFCFLRRRSNPPLPV